MRSAVRFRLPPELEATAPPEARGLRRDHVRLLVVDRADGSVTHHRFHELPRLLEPGDLLVANDSRTLPASLLGRTASGEPLEVRLDVRVLLGGGLPRHGAERDGEPVDQALAGRAQAQAQRFGAHLAISRAAAGLLKERTASDGVRKSL